MELHERLIAAANALLDLPEEGKGLVAADALGFFLGGLINAMPPGGKAPSKHVLVELVEHTAERLGCPPVAPVVPRGRR